MCSSDAVSYIKSQCSKVNKTHTIIYNYQPNKPNIKIIKHRLLPHHTHAAQLPAPVHAADRPLQRHLCRRSCRSKSARRTAYGRPHVRLRCLRGRPAARPSRLSAGLRHRAALGRRLDACRIDVHHRPGGVRAQLIGQQLCPNRTGVRMAVGERWCAFRKRHLRGGWRCGRHRHTRTAPLCVLSLARPAHGRAPSADQHQADSVAQRARPENGPHYRPTGCLVFVGRRVSDSAGPLGWPVANVRILRQ